MWSARKPGRRPKNLRHGAITYVWCQRGRVVQQLAAIGAKRIVSSFREVCSHFTTIVWSLACMIILKIPRCCSLEFPFHIFRHHPGSCRVEERWCHRCVEEEFHGDGNSWLWLVKVAHTHLVQWNLTWTATFKVMRSTRYLMFWWQDLDVHPLCCCNVVFPGLRYRVGDELCFRGGVVETSALVVAVMRSSRMVVVCLRAPLMRRTVICKPEVG